MSFVGTAFAVEVYGATYETLETTAGMYKLFIDDAPGPVAERVSFSPRSRAF